MHEVNLKSIEMRIDVIYFEDCAAEDQDFIVNVLREDTNIDSVNKEEFRKFKNDPFQAEGHVGCEIYQYQKLMINNY